MDRSSATLTDADVETIERSTLAVVVPDELLSLPGWLVPVFDGTVGRAKSAVPLSHAAPDLDMIEVIVDHYRSRGAMPAFRLPELDTFAAFQGALQQRGFTRRQPTLVMHGRVADLMAQALDPVEWLVADVAVTPDAAWLGMFLGPGLDLVDGASRTRALVRGAETRYVSLRENGVTVACGAAGLSGGWLSVHGMRTALSRRGQGLAPRVLRAMAQHAQTLGIDRVFLQVDANNAPALVLYRRAQFQVAWPYAYWEAATPRV